MTLASMRAATSIYYDPCEACHPRADASGRDRRAGAGARCVLHRRHSPRFGVSVPVGGNTQSTLAPAGCRPDLSPRIPQRLSPIVPANRHALIAAVAAAIDHVIGERERISVRWAAAWSRANAGAPYGSATSRWRCRSCVKPAGSPCALSETARPAQFSPLPGNPANRCARHGAWHAGGSAGAPDPQRVSARARRGRGQGLRLHRARRRRHG